MKILWCIVFYLVFNDFLAIASKLQNENEDTYPIKNIMQRMEALEKSFEKSNNGIIKIQNESTKKIGALEILLEESIARINSLEYPHGRVDCGEKCEIDESCTSVFWSNSSDSECRFNQDKSTLVKFVPGEFYYCKDCQTTLDLVFEGEYSGVIKLVNVATNKTTQASSYVNANSDPSKALDGDMNTWFSSEALLTKGEPWLMVDLGQRFLVAQIRIQVRKKPIYKIMGGYFQVCLVNDFSSKVNPCNQHSEVLEVNRRLRAYSELFDMKKVIMSRYIFIKKLKDQVLEIAELEIISVIPTMSYECASCIAKSNTVCDESRIPPVCSCAENHLPVDGDVINGCKDPCLGIHVRNGECFPLNSKDSNCLCKEGFVPMCDQNPCFGCKKDCTSHAGYAFYKNFGCLKAHDDKGTEKNWECAREECMEEGGDLFTPGNELPLLPKEMGLDTSENWGLWVGIKRHDSGPFKRIATDQSQLQDDSRLWDNSYSTKEVNRDCVDYGAKTKLLYNNTCTRNFWFICQIYDI